jgi:RNA polymerase sigma-70 factor (ECF subfamily)
MSGRRREVLEEFDDGPSASSADEWVDDQDAELAVCLRTLLAELPPDYRRALELTDLGGLSQAEAAELEHVSLSGMKSRVQRGRRQLGVVLRQCCTPTLDSRGVPVDYRPRPDICP